MSGDDAGERLPVDTLSPPHEPTVTPSRSWPMWVLLVGGPALWFAHFMVVYLTAEAVCTPGMVGAEEPWSRDTLGWFIVGATAVFALVCLVLAGLAVRARAHMEDGVLRGVAIVLSAGSAVGVLVVGIPTLAVGTC